MKISVIIPTLNEAQILHGLFDSLRDLPEAECEIIFVDGGSKDDSVYLIETAGFKILKTEHGRAHQMNLGAQNASGDTLLFLHADTYLPPSALNLVSRALSDSRYCWGRFDVRISSSRLVLSLVAFLMNWRSRLTGIATGDQAIFVKRSTFHAIGGFPHQPLMEDIELSKRLRQISRPACLTLKVGTSGRRWETKGVWRTVLLMWRLRLAYWRGAPAQELARIYYGSN